MPDSDLNDFFERIATPQLLTQILLTVVAVLAGLTVGHFARAACRRGGYAQRDSWQARVVQGAALGVAPFTAMVALLAGRSLLRLAGPSADLLDIALQFGAALLLIRIGLYVLTLALGRPAWLLRREYSLTFVLWIVVSFSMLGWLGFVETSLDAVDLIPGTARFTVWALLKGLVIVTVFVLFSSLLSRTLERRVMKLDELAMSTRLGITKFTYFFLITLGVMIGINAAGVDLTALTVLTGAVGIGLGFGLQSIASNFVSGFVLLMDKSIKPGDVISFTGMTGTSTENFGWVQELRGRYVVVRDRDGVETLVPNQNLITSPVINWSYSDRKVRLKLPVRISYSNDPEIALAVLLQAAQCNPRVLRDPEPVSRLMHFSDHGIDLELRFWIADPQNGVNNVRSDVNRAIWQQFKAADIVIPVAQREVRLVTTRGGGP
jgi:small-conductance mechanosensitive channel